MGPEIIIIKMTLAKVFFVPSTWSRAAWIADLLAWGGIVFKLRTVGGNMKLPKLSVKY
jgi:hypothetical protein